jgi:hypothetical protein
MDDDAGWVDDGTDEEKVSRINEMSLVELKEVLLSIVPSMSFTASDGTTYDLTLHDTKTIPSDVFQACFSLVKQNLRHLYKASSIGWSVKSKQAEMREPATRFLVLHGPKQILGFTSWQVDMEDDAAVIYWYLSLLSNQLRITTGDFSPSQWSRSAIHADPGTPRSTLHSLKNNVDSLHIQCLCIVILFQIGVNSLEKQTDRDTPSIQFLQRVLPSVTAASSPITKSCQK